MSPIGLMSLIGLISPISLISPICLTVLLTIITDYHGGLSLVW